MNFLELPEDILSIVYLYLDPKSFLNLCQTCKTLYGQYRQDPLFWRTKTSATFRIPISPLLKADGERWYWLYKRLKTQTRLYTWGQGLKGALGHGRGLRIPIRRGGPRGVPPLAPLRHVFERVTSSWPTEGHLPDEIGVIADLQCGGWSTTILSAEGKLYTTGSIDSRDGINIGKSSNGFQRLEYLTQSHSAIRQFSSGRSHILALTDDSEVLSWDRIDSKGLKIFSRHGESFSGKIIKVCAGWAESSAYIPDVGIIYWTPPKNDQQNEMLDAVHVKEKVIPNTAQKATDNETVEVTAYTVLENFIVWVTSDSKIWACSITHDDDEDTQPKSPPFQVPGYESSLDQIQDVQGSFRNFAVFTSSGRVLAGHTDYLNACFTKALAHFEPDSDGTGPGVVSDPSTWSDLEALIASKPASVPALQHSQVIALAFGDYHYHALHSNGKITSYGKEPQSCGCLGLGPNHVGGQFRGLRKAAFGRDTELLPISNLRGRQVWFESEKKDWLTWLVDIMDKAKLQGVQDMLQDIRLQSMISEWVEQEGRHWEQGPQQHTSQAKTGPKLSSEDFSHLGSYFAIAVSAAGWHSGSLVLVDEEKADHTLQLWQKTYERPQGQEDRKIPGSFEQPLPNPETSPDLGTKYIWEDEKFPKIQLPNGTEVPGNGEVCAWRDGMPTLSDLGLS